MSSIFKENAINALKENANWLTVTAVGLIVIVGITVVNNPANWWTALVAVLGFSLLSFIVINGRVVLKAFFSILVLVGSIIAGATMSIFITNDIFFNLAWPLYTLAAWCLSLALSYMFYSGAGRWSYLTLATLLNFFATVGLISVGAGAQLSAIISSVVSVFVFLLLYKFNKRTRVPDTMPANGFSKELYSSLEKGAQELNMKLRLVDGKKDIGPHFIVYGKRAYVIYPVLMDQAFGVTGRMGRQLSYLSKPINPWLAKLAFISSISWKARGANPPLALVDLKRRNGSESKLIGISLPDSKRKAVIGIAPAPAKSMERDAYGRQLITSVIKLMKDYSDDLTSKQEESLGNIGYVMDDFVTGENIELPVTDSIKIIETKDENAEGEGK